LSENVKEFDRALARYVRHLVIEEKEQSCSEEQQRIVHVVEAMKMSGRSDDKMNAEEVAAHNLLLFIVVNRIVNL
jgi:hypothetical protein